MYLSRDEVQILVRTLFDLGKEKRGALIVIRGKDLIARHLEGGTDLNGELSEGLLKSIFDPHSIGHDGAVIIEGNRVIQYSCHLPLSKNLKAVGKGGTRHAAALGLSELTDSLCLVVSEERGTISLAQDGNIEIISDPDKLTILIEKHYQETYPQKELTAWNYIRKNGAEKVLALILAMAIWFVFSHGSKIVYKTYKAPINVTTLPEPWVVKSFDPKEVDVTVYGPRKTFYFANRDHFKFIVNLKKGAGTQIIRLTSKNLKLRSDIHLEAIEPHEVRVTVEKSSKSEEK